MVGEDSNLCLNEESWEHPFPSCREVVCPNIQSLANGRVSVEGFRFRRIVHYSCNEGYVLVGDNTRTCLETGNWSGEDPTCTPRMCQEPPEIQNGFLDDVFSLEYGSVITYRCEDGFKLVGGGERVCGHTGQWSGQQPVCVNTSQTCLVPQLLNSGYVAFDGNLDVGSLAWYDCNDDYNLVGADERSCIENGTWTGDEPVCHPKFCSPVQHILHGKVMGTTYEYGSTLQFSCNSGFSLNGADTVHCSETGTWSHPLPVCVPVVCVEPEPVKNGVIRGSARRYDDSIVYECSPGFTLLGSRVRKCDLSGEWSGTKPHCASITCPELPGIINGVSTIELRVPGERARFRCNLGYRIEGNTNITCSSAGEWVGEPPSCVPAYCRINTTTNASIVGEHQEQYEVGTKLSWTCSAGYKMIGPNLITCLPNGEWDVEAPSCHIHQCKDVLRLENGVIFGTKNSSQSLEVRFSCDNGYHKIMDSFLQCEVDGRWTGNPPICSKRVCQNNFSVDHADVVFKPVDGSYLAELRCQDRFELRGEGRMVCRKDGEWSAPPPQCSLEYCPLVGNLKKMIYDRRKVRIGESVKFQCEPGYELRGSGFVKCLRTGVWEEPFPVCVPGVCRFPSRIQNGAWNLVPSQYKKSLWAKGLRTGDEEINDNDREASLSVGDLLRVSCDPGYDVYGQEEVLCLNDLTLSTRIPKCKPVHCPRLEQIENGGVHHNGTYRGATASFSCNRGFELVGSSSRKCKRNRTWSRSYPVCKPIKCKKPHNIAHGQVDYNPNDLGFGSKVKFYCNLGYELTGPNERQCGDDGSWVGEEPECVLVRCPPPKILLHGEQDINELTVGGTVSYTCNTGFRLEGSRLLTCLHNKTWSGQVPSCTKVACQLPRNISHGSVFYSETEYQAHVEYSCENGYILSGLRTRSCLHSGHWSGDEPSCVPSICNTIGKHFIYK